MPLLIAIVILLTGCATNPPVEPDAWVGKYGNACLPEAISMAQGLRANGIQARVLNIHTHEFGHAVCVYLYPPGENKLWAWDSYWKSIRLRAYWDDPMGVARAWLRWTQHDHRRLKSAYYHEASTGAETR